MEKIAFITHSYHKKTQSYDFIVNYLKEFYDVELLFDEEWDTGKKIDWAKFDNRYKAVIILQMFPENEEKLKKITNNNIIYIPMYDHVENWPFRKWYLCKDIKIVNFSSTLHKKLSKWGFNSIYVQFFIEPKEFSPGIDNEVFFWQRLSKVNINTIKKILAKSNVKLHIHKTADPGHYYVEPTKEDEKRFNITYSEWFDTKEEAQSLVKSKGIYISPRFAEGIGMGFLEAMSQGKIVIANNKPTMNEYIKHGKTGFLCNFRFPRPIKISNIREIQQNAYNYSKAGYEKWLVERKNIIDFIEKEPKKNELKLWTKLRLPILLLDRKKIIKFKLGSNACLVILGKQVI